MKKIQKNMTYKQEQEMLERRIFGKKNRHPKDEDPEGDSSPKKEKARARSYSMAVSVTARKRDYSRD